MNQDMLTVELSVEQAEDLIAQLFGSSEATCKPCATGKYQAQTSHRELACGNQVLCPPGSKIVDLASTTKAQCEACLPGKHQPSVGPRNMGHREQTCRDQKKCDNHTQYTESPGRPTADAVCQNQVSVVEHPLPLHAAKIWRQFVFTCSLGTGLHVK